MHTGRRPQVNSARNTQENPGLASPKSHCGILHGAKCHLAHCIPAVSDGEDFFLERHRAG